ncbi:MAG: hypothetical protein M3Q86_13610 [Verrucomicrobiota bacterium]|nr:hypothetical protein [Verrucomicrobiota bacterium]
MRWDAFPNQYVTLAVGGSGTLDQPFTEVFVARSTISTARLVYGERMIAQRNNLSTTTPVAPGTGTLWSRIWDFQPDVGAQMVNVCVDSQTCGVGLDPESARRSRTVSITG